jgi:broad specificity phosphatase PhoE
VATTLYIVRHGETDWNRDRRIQGQTDIPLNAEGHRQAEGLALELAATALDAAYASDLSRAWETAAAVAEPRGLEVTRKVALREKHFGTWEGMTDDEVLERFPHAVNGSWGDAETTEQLTERVVGAIHDIARDHPEGSVLVVSHGGAIRSLYRAVGVDQRRIGNCTVATFVVTDGRLALVDER